jgi:DNA-directed RNA polymerase
MMKTTNIAYENGIRNFCNVHDSFATTAGDVETLTASLKEAFIQIFTEHDVLKEFKEDVFHQIPENLRAKLPDVPEKGDLDITLLRECDFFFA